MSVDHGELHPSPVAARRRQLDDLRQGCTREQALALYDCCPAVAVEEMTGAWSGGELPTGHPLDGLLAVAGWRGKRFDGPDQVHPLLCGEPGREFSVNPRVAPMRQLGTLAPVLRLPMAGPVVRRAERLARTRRPRARLRAMEHRGVVTATIVYDAQPIHDHLRRIDEDTVLGLMDLRGEDQPYFFWLARQR